MKDGEFESRWGARTERLWLIKCVSRVGVGPTMQAKVAVCLEEHNCVCEGGGVMGHKGHTQQS